jgi:hypothetical protein
VALDSDRQCENQHSTLLIDIRTVFDRYDKDRLRTKAELIPALAGLEDSPWGEWTGWTRKVISAACYAPSPSDRRRFGRRDDARERNQDIPVSNSRRLGLLLRTNRHTATGKQIQVLVAAVNRHMPATPSRCRRRR